MTQLADTALTLALLRALEPALRSRTMAQGT